MRQHVSCFSRLLVYLSARHLFTRLLVTRFLIFSSLVYSSSPSNLLRGEDSANPEKRKTKLRFVFLCRSPACDATGAGRAAAEGKCQEKSACNNRVQAEHKNAEPKWQKIRRMYFQIRPMYLRIRPMYFRIHPMYFRGFQRYLVFSPLRGVFSGSRTGAERRRLRTPGMRRALRGVKIFTPRLPAAPRGGGSLP